MSAPVPFKDSEREGIRMSDFQVWLEDVKQAAYMAFIQGDRWKLYFKGLGVTMQLAVYAAIIGMIIGTIIAFMKLSTRKNGKPGVWNKGPISTSKPQSAYPVATTLAPRS